MIRVVRDAIRPEGHDAIGSEIGDVIRDRGRAVVPLAGAVLEAEETHLVHADVARLAHSSRRLCRPSRLGGHACGSLVPCSPSVAVTTTTTIATAPAGRHQACGEIGLIVGMGPHTEQRAGFHVGTPGSSWVMASTSSARADMSFESRRVISSSPQSWLVMRSTTSNSGARDGHGRWYPADHVVERLAFAEPIGDRSSEELGVAEGIGQAVEADRVAEAAHVADQSPSPVPMTGGCIHADRSRCVRRHRGRETRNRSATAGDPCPR